MTHFKTSSQRRSNEKLRRKKHIITSARAVFKKEGFIGATMEMVAGRANLAKGTLYYHFADKESLLFAVLEEILLEFEVSSKKLFLLPGISGILTEWGQSLFRSFRENYEVFTGLRYVVIHRHQKKKSDVSQNCAEAMHSYMRNAAQIIHALQERITAADPVYPAFQIAEMLIAVVMGSVIRFVHTDRDTARVEQSIVSSIEVLKKGFGIINKEKL